MVLLHSLLRLLPSVAHPHPGTTGRDIPRLRLLQPLLHSLLHVHPACPRKLLKTAKVTEVMKRGVMVKKSSPEAAEAVGFQGFSYRAVQIAVMIVTYSESSHSSIG